MQGFGFWVSGFDHESDVDVVVPEGPSEDDQLPTKSVLLKSIPIQIRQFMFL